MSVLTYPQLDARTLGLLRGAVDRAGSIGQVAQQLDYSRAAISTALAGKYPANIGKLRERILQTYEGSVLCPHLARDITAADCSWWRTRPCPTSRREDAEHWIACKFCPLNPDRRNPDCKEPVSCSA